MGMVNNTKVRVRIDMKELIQAAFIELARQGDIPYATGGKLLSRYEVKCDEPSECEGIYVEFFVEEKKEEQVEYTAGSWRDPELENV